MAKIEDLIDVSKWGGLVLWEDVTIKKCMAAYIKASQSTWADSKFEYNRSELIRLRFPWGAYHYFDPLYDARNQAKLFANLVGHYDATGRYIFDSQLIPILDVERRQSYISKQKLYEDVRAFSREFKARTNIYPGIYTRASFWNSNMPNLKDRESFGARYLWVAHYNLEIENPWIPVDWDNWDLWQFSADHNGRGAEFGLTGSKSVDLNRVNGGLAALEARYPNVTFGPFTDGLPDPEPEPEPEPETREVQICTTLGNMNCRSAIIPSRLYGPMPGMNYEKSEVYFVIPKGRSIEVLEEIIDGHNIWIRTGQRQYVAKKYDGYIYLS